MSNMWLWQMLKPKTPKWVKEGLVLQGKILERGGTQAMLDVCAKLAITSGYSYTTILKNLSPLLVVSLTEAQVMEIIEDASPGYWFHYANAIIGMQSRGRR